MAAWQVYRDDNIAACAKIAVEETGMDVYEDKLTKHKVKVLGVCRDIKHAKTVGVIKWDEARGLTKYAKPIGVIGALNPVTNPTATGGAVMAKVSRILVRQAHAPSAGGHFHNGMPSTVTLGCGTWGGNITNENIHWRHFINMT